MAVDSFGEAREFSAITVKLYAAFSSRFCDKSLIIISSISFIFCPRLILFYSLTNLNSTEYILLGGNEPR